SHPLFHPTPGRAYAVARRGQPLGRHKLETEETFEFDIAGFTRATARRQATGVMDPEDLEQDLWVFYLEELAGSDYPPGTINDLIKRRAAKIDRQERIEDRKST